MLNWNTVLTFCKGNIGLPSGYLEKTDKEITDWLKMTIVPEFSQFYPDIAISCVIVDNGYYKGDSRQGVYNFFDEENLPIYGIKECYTSVGEDVITGHPVSGPSSLTGLKWWLLDVAQSNLFRSFCDWDFSFTFIPPNKVQVIPCENVPNFVVEYEREQPNDLRKIPAAMTRQFMQLALSETMIWIGNLRSMYTDTSTPFGPSTLKGEEMVSKGEEMKDKLISLWQEDTIPSITLEKY